MKNSKQSNALSALSFEFFPPRDEKAQAALWRTLEVLAPLAPDFVSVTYGAGGSLRQRTRDIVLEIQQRTGLPVAAHMTCVGESRADLLAEAKTYWQEGIKHIVALRGDMPDMAEPYRPHPEGFASTPEFIKALKEIAPFEVSVSAYPETHPDSPSPEADVALLRDKITAGASRAITQFAFESEAHIAYRERIRAADVDVPLVPGIMPTTNFAGVQRMAAKCGASVPNWLAQAYQGLEDDLPARREVAIEIALRQCKELLAAGFGALHFYTLNQAKITHAVCTALKSRA